MQQQFKTGDHVVCVEPAIYRTRSGPQAGARYVVQENLGPLIRVHGIAGVWRMDRFRPVGASGLRFTVGDRVVMLTGRNGVIPAGALCTVVDVDTAECVYPYRVRADDGAVSWVKVNHVGPDLEPANTKLRFKAGDCVVVNAATVTRVPAGSLGVVVQVDERDASLPYRVRFKGGTTWVSAAEVSALPPAAADPRADRGPFIVIARYDGELRPATVPHLHQTREAAEKEALRLAGEHPGKLFEVWTYGGATAHREVPVETKAEMRRAA